MAKRGRPPKADKDSKATKKAAAAKKPNKKSAAPAAAKVGDPNDKRIRRVITDGQLTTLLKTVNSYEKQGGELSGALREKIAYSVEKQYLHKGAFSILRKFHKMDLEDAALLWDMLGIYMEKSGLMDELKGVPEFDFKTDAEISGQKDLLEREKVQKAETADAPPASGKPSLVAGRDVAEKAGAA